MCVIDPKPEEQPCGGINTPAPRAKNRFDRLKYPHEVIPIDDLHFYRRKTVAGSYKSIVYQICTKKSRNFGFSFSFFL